MRCADGNSLSMKQKVSRAMVVRGATDAMSAICVQAREEIVESWSVKQLEAEGARTRGLPKLSVDEVAIGVVLPRTGQLTLERRSLPIKCACDTASSAPRQTIARIVAKFVMARDSLTSNQLPPRKSAGKSTDFGFGSQKAGLVLN